MHRLVSAVPELVDPGRDYSPRVSSGRFSGATEVDSAVRLGSERLQLRFLPCCHRPTKTSTTVRIDSDVLHWLRAHGKGYQSRLNAILRREMLASLKVTSAKQG